MNILKSLGLVRLKEHTEVLQQLTQATQYADGMQKLLAKEVDILCAGHFVTIEGLYEPRIFIPAGVQNVIVRNCYWSSHDKAP